MMKRLLIAGVAAALCMVGAASREAYASPPAGKPIGPMPGTPVITGTVYLGKTPSHEQVTLPGMAMVYVELLDISGKNPLSSALGEDTVWVAAGKLPIEFRIAYDPSRVDPSHVYIVRARVMEGEKVLLLNTTPVYVLTRGAPSKIDIIVTPAQVRVR
ncbi:MAG: YbaY family lipoprotein [Deltaproteobacteria bacterium]|nr:YbaY family lipoprotein [Candidatus Deferrimicrobiaceae bacterium]